MKTIIINENKERQLFQSLINEKMTIDKVSVVKDFLDKNFKRADTTELDDSGMVSSKPIVVWIDSHQNPVKTMTDEQLFYVLQEKFKNIIADKEERNSFLKKMLKAWYYNKISKYGSIIE